VGSQNFVCSGQVALAFTFGDRELDQPMYCSLFCLPSAVDDVIQSAPTVTIKKPGAHI
jgi:hypothetical protein